MKISALTAAGILTARRTYGADAIDPSRLPFGGTWNGIAGVQDVDPDTYIQHNVSAANGGSDTGVMPSTATREQINAAIIAAGAAGGNRFVKLGPGTFTISGGNLAVSTDSVELRGSVDGAGFPATILQFSDASNRLLLTKGTAWDHYYYATASAWTTRNLTGVPSRGATSVTATASLTGGSGGTPAVGGLMAITAPKNAPNIDIEVAEFSQFFSETSGGQRPWMQIVKITAVNTGTNTISFTPAINADYLSGTIQIHWRPSTQQLNYSGIRNLKFQVAGGGRFTGSNGGCVQLSGNNQCWIDNIFTEGHQGGGFIDAAVMFYFCYGCELTHSQIRNTASFASSTYGISVYGASGLKIENNHIYQVSNCAMLLNMSGSVIAYNYCHDQRYGNFNSQWIFFHGSHFHYNLFEGGWGSGHYMDEIAGGNSTQSRNTLYCRERMTGWDSADGGNGAIGTEANNVCLTHHLHHDNVTVAGCVLGTAGKQTEYETLVGGAPSTTSTGAIYRHDATTAATMERLGNYNFFNSAIPAGEALGVGETIADSYYLASKPLWFGNRPWPWCDPSNPTQSNDPENLPAAFRFIYNEDPPADEGPPSITNQPRSQSVANGTAANLSVTAGGAPTLSYQWFEGESGDTSTPIDGATDSTYTTPALTAAANYWVRITNGEGSIDSTTAVIIMGSFGDGGGTVNAQRANVGRVISP